MKTSDKKRLDSFLDTLAELIATLFILSIGVFLLTWSLGIAGFFWKVFAFIVGFRILFTVWEK